MNHSLKLCAIILCGGQSRRFGEDKAIHKYEGQPLYQHVTNVVQHFVDIEDIYYSVNERNRHQIVADDSNKLLDVSPFDQCGPITGLYSVMLHCDLQHKYYDGYIVLSVDALNMDNRSMNRLIKEFYNQQCTVVAKEDVMMEGKDDVKLHPLIGIYNNAFEPIKGDRLIDILHAQLLNKDYKVMNLLQKVNYKAVQLPSYVVKNMNRKEDLYGRSDS